MFTFFCISALGTAALWITLLTFRHRLQSYAPLVACFVAVIIAAVTAYAFQNSQPQYLGPNAARITSPWSECILFASMILGVICNHFAVIVLDRRKKRKRKHSRGELVFPLLISVIMFGFVLRLVDPDVLRLESCIVSFEHGFLWRSGWAYIAGML
jgi:H+/Cl- antiporter ClcA